MNPPAAALVLVLLAGTLFILPLLPAIGELLLKRDAKPLQVIRQHSGEIKHFAEGFREYIQPLVPALQQCVQEGRNATGNLPGGEEYLLLGRPVDGDFEFPKDKECCPMIVAAGTDRFFPSGLTFAKEVYAAGQLTGGRRNTYRAIFGEKGLFLERGCKVLRWAHAAGKLEAQADCELYGRISSDQEIQLVAGCVFQRLHAPRIIAGERIPSCILDFPSQAQPPRVTAARRLFEEDLEIRPGDVIAGDLVTRGNLRIRAGARVFGSVKGNRGAVLEEGVWVMGSVISAGPMRIGPRCRISGLLIAEHEMAIDVESQCGTLEQPTTASAPTIRLASGVTIFGTVWAREKGRAVDRL